MRACAVAMFTWVIMIKKACAYISWAKAGRIFARAQTLRLNILQVTFLQTTKQISRCKLCKPGTNFPKKHNLVTIVFISTHILVLYTMKIPSNLPVKCKIFKKKLSPEAQQSLNWSEDEAVSDWRIFLKDWGKFPATAAMLLSIVQEPRYNNIFKASDLCCFLMDHRFEDVHPRLPSAWENWDFNFLPPKYPGDIGNYHKLLSQLLDLSIQVALVLITEISTKKQQIVECMPPSFILEPWIQSGHFSVQKPKGDISRHLQNKALKLYPKVRGPLPVLSAQKVWSYHKPPSRGIISHVERMLRIWDTFFGAWHSCYKSQRGLSTPPLILSYFSLIVSIIGGWWWGGSR